MSHTVDVCVGQTVCHHFSPSITSLQNFHTYIHIDSSGPWGPHLPWPCAGLPCKQILLPLSFPVWLKLTVYFVHCRHWMLPWSSSRHRLLIWLVCSFLLTTMLVKSCAWAACQRSVLLPVCFNAFPFNCQWYQRLTDVFCTVCTTKIGVVLHFFYYKAQLLLLSYLNVCFIWYSNSIHMVCTLLTAQLFKLS